MINVLADKQEELVRLCKRYHVRQLDVFGSAVSEDAFDPDRSDLDFLVEFDRSNEMNRADQYFGLWEALREVFGREVDLVTLRALRNPYFIKSVNATREVVYAA